MAESNGAPQKRFLYITVQEASGKSKDQEVLWEPSFTEGFVRGGMVAHVSALLEDGLQGPKSACALYCAAGYTGAPNMQCMTGFELLNVDHRFIPVQNAISVQLRTSRFSSAPQFAGLL
eukprot:evm.model.scf_2472.2 EVM.evm.TU.scf_2472.2   scf_2472:17289-17645(+)